MCRDDDSDDDGSSPLDAPRCHAEAQWLDVHFVGDRYICYRDTTRALHCRDLLRGKSYQIAPTSVDWHAVIEGANAWREGDAVHVFDTCTRTALADMPRYDQVVPFGRRRAILTSGDGRPRRES